MTTAAKSTAEAPPVGEGTEIEVNRRRYLLTHLRTETDGTWGDIRVGALDLPVRLDRLPRGPLAR